ncbi:MAG: hypothetical protein WCK86_14120 [Planctomycetia bacterium]
MNRSQKETLEAAILRAMMDFEYHPVTASALAGKMQLEQAVAEEFREAIEGLIAAGRIRQDKHGRMKLRGASGTVTGILRKISSGAAFVIPSERLPELKGADVYVTARDLGDAQTGDEVLVRILARRRSNGQRCGIIDRIVKRATSVFVGTWSETGGQGYVQVDGGQFTGPIHVGDPGAKGPKKNDKVVIEMLRFPTDRRHGEAVLIKVLGRRGDQGVDTQSVIHSLGLPQEFPEAALNEARIQASHFDEMSFADREDLTAETIKDGWLHTGDIGMFEDRKYLKITDRKKELFKTSGGKYVAPQPIENKLKESPYVEQMMVVGADEKFVGAFIVPSFSNLKEWMRENKIPFTSNENAIENEKVIAFYQELIDSFNKFFNQVEQVKKFVLLPHEWTIDGGELTPTLKLKRKAIMEKYKAFYSAIYQQ